MRTLVVGDIHGSVKALHQVLEKSNFNPDSDRLVQLGDIADGWTETKECIDVLLDIEKQSLNSNKPIFIRGNHDVWVYDWILYGITPPVWIKQGGKATIESYRDSKTNQIYVNEEHKSFWRRQQDWFIDEKNRLFIHGGWRHIMGFPAGAQEKINAGTIARECHWNRSLLLTLRTASQLNTEHQLISDALKQFTEVYVGHTEIPGETPCPENIKNLWNLDTGCGSYGVLTIVDIDTKQYWQSDRSRSFYPITFRSEIK